MDRGGFVTLSPRQSVTPSPYAVTAANVVSGGLLSGVYSNSVSFTNTGNNFVGNGSGLSGINATAIGGIGVSNLWQLTGNAGTAPGANYIGTSESLFSNPAKPLELRVNGMRALRLEPGPFNGNPGASRYGHVSHPTQSPGMA